MFTRPAAQRTPSLARLLASAVTRACAFGTGVAVLSLGGAGTVQTPSADSPAYTTPVGDAPAPVARLMEEYDCSTLGYGDEATPLSALVLRPGGRVRVVSFAAGWRAWTEEGSTQLVAVCLRPHAED